MELLKRIKSFILTKHFLKHTGLIILFYILVIGATVLYLSAYTNHGQKIKVPYLIGKNVNSIKTQIEELDLTYEIIDSIYRPDLPEGTILEQNPEPTSVSWIYVKEGRVIGLRLSKKSEFVEMPSLIDKSQSYAEVILENRGLKVRLVFEPSNEADGAVLEQRYQGKIVKEGTRVPIGSYITLTIGRNEAGPPIPMINLIGMTIFEARDRLNEIGAFVYMPICPDCLTSEDSTVARISSQTPEFVEGMTVPGGSTITVYATKELIENAQP